MTTSSSGVPESDAPTNKQPDYLVRFGTDFEYAARLEALAEAAARVGLPHGVSAIQNLTPRTGSSFALRSTMEDAGFPVVKTGRAKHYIVVLPHPVTEDAANRFDAVFGRYD